MSAIPSSQGVKLYVRTVACWPSPEQKTTAVFGKNDRRGSDDTSESNHDFPLSLAWSPQHNCMFLLRRAFTEKVVVISKDELMKNVTEATITVNGPTRLCWSILHTCNLHCPYCLDGGKGLPVPALGTQQIYLKNMLSSQTLLTIDFSGGEPLLHRHLYELMDQVKKAGVGITITTHGGFLERHAERLSQYVDGIRVSLDGSTAEKHDRLRGKRGLFDALMRGIQKAQQCGIRLRINTVAMRQNSGDWEDIIKLARDLGAEEVSLLQFLPLGMGGTNVAEYFINTRDFLERGRELKARYETPSFEVRLRDLEGATGYVTMYSDGSMLANADLDSALPAQRQEVLGYIDAESLDAMWQKRFGTQLLHLDIPPKLL